MEGMKSQPNKSEGLPITDPRLLFKDYQELKIMVRAYEKALTILQQQSVDMNDFTDLYTEEQLQKYQHYVDEKEREFAEKRKKNPGWARSEVFGKTLEGLLHDQMSKVFGEGIQGTSTTAYDDYHAGVDEVIELSGEKEGDHSTFGIDFTYGDPREKIELICKNIKRGKLTDVLFYESPEGSDSVVRGKLQNLPKVAIGMDGHHVMKLAQQWNEGDEKLLEYNQLFLLIVRQIQIQAEVYEFYATQQQQVKIADQYKKLHEDITHLYNSLKREHNVGFLDKRVLNDGIHKTITQQMEKITKK